MKIACELAHRLKTRPDETFCLIAIERNVTRAVLVAHLSETHRRRIWLWQAQAEPGFRYSALLFEGLRAWAKAKKAKEIRMTTDERKKRFFERQYGFRRKGEEMIYNVA